MTLNLWQLGPEDLSEAYVHWLNDQKVNRFTSRGAFPVTWDEAEQYLRSCQSRERIVLAVGIGDRHIGNVSLQKIDLLNRSAELAILIGETSEQGKGYGLEAARLICAQGFNALGLNRIYCGTHEENIGMQKLALKLGMKEEGRSRKALFKNGKFSDIIHYGILREEFQCL